MRAHIVPAALGAVLLLTLAPSLAHGAIAVSVDPALDRRTVNPRIYGINYGAGAEFTDLPYPLRRWGGNSTSRYSWMLDTHNSGADWYFISTPGDSDPLDTSVADGCTAGPDQAAHGGVPLLEWWLAQGHAHEVTNGMRLADVLDVHYSPQSGGALNDDESAAAAANRLRSVKSLYDLAYVDESWIGQPVRLIPRLRDMIATRAPGLGIAITEYNFGGDTGISSALAQAEALAVFGREGVELATRWVAPASGSKVQEAFRLYLGYDGAGARVDGTSVRATTAKVDSVGAYALEGADGRVFVLLFNKHTAGETVALTVAGGGDRAVSLHRFTAAIALAAAGTTALSGGALSLALPARSHSACAARPIPRAARCRSRSRCRATATWSWRSSTWPAGACATWRMARFRRGRIAGAGTGSMRAGARCPAASTCAGFARSAPARVCGSSASGSIPGPAGVQCPP